MKVLNHFTAILTVFALMSFQNNSDKKPEPIVVVNVKNVQHHEGNIKAILYNRDNFLTDKFISCIEIPMQNTQGTTAQMVFKNLPAGSYAIAIYHDLNSNDNFDRNWFGYPKEPFAISNNLHPFNLLLPSFDKAKFDFNNQPTSLTIDLMNN